MTDTDKNRIEEAAKIYSPSGIGLKEFKAGAEYEHEFLEDILKRIEFLERKFKNVKLKDNSLETSQ